PHFACQPAPSSLATRALPLPPPLFPYTTLFRSEDAGQNAVPHDLPSRESEDVSGHHIEALFPLLKPVCENGTKVKGDHEDKPEKDRKSTRLNSSHVKISYAVFCLKKKKTKIQTQ